MKERAILFSTPMVRAILDGRKTQTRRVCKPQPGPRCDGVEKTVLRKLTERELDNRPANPWVRSANPGVHTQRNLASRRASTIVGEMPTMLRSESFWRWMLPGAISAGFRCPYGEAGDRLWVRETFAKCRHGEKHPACIEYRADDPSNQLTWTPSMHMPRWASRITLEITDVRVERVQQITEDSAKAEGFECREDFTRLWRTLGFGADSWVWVIEFKRVE